VNFKLENTENICWITAKQEMFEEVNINFSINMKYGKNEINIFDLSEVITKLILKMTDLYM